MAHRCAPGRDASDHAGRDRYRRDHHDRDHHDRDRYRDAASGWATGAAHVYGPLAHALVTAAPHPLTGRLVLDVGAGTGLASDVLAEVGATPIALDVSVPMLRACRHRGRVAGAVEALPLGTRTVDDAVAAFVLNHTHRPVDALRDLARVVRPGGAVLATVMSADNHSPVRDRIDVVAAAHGFVAPGWYRELTREQAPRLGSAARMTAAALDAGLSRIAVDEGPVELDLGAAALVDYRLGQAQYGRWLAGLDDGLRARVRDEALAAVEPVMEPYRPGVVRLTALVRAG